MSTPVGTSPKSRKNPQTLPGKPGMTKGRGLPGRKNGYMGVGRGKIGPGSGKNAGSGTT